jgi:hypothetical protein
MDELKKYIQNHAEELDLDEPRPQVWQNIQRETQPVKKTTVVVMITRWAAAACILALAGIGAWYVFGNKNTSHTDTVAITEKEKSQQIQPAPIQSEPVATEKNEPELLANVETHTAKNNPQPTTRNPQQTLNQEALNTLHDIETSFTQVINLQIDRVSHIPMFTESPEYFKDFTIQIRQMEKDEKVIKSDIAKRGMTDVLLDQLINLYQQKLNTLKQLQLEMNKTNNRYKQNRSPVDSTKTYFLNL